MRLTRKSGFSRIGLILSIGLLLALSAVLVPAFQVTLDDSRVAEIATLYDLLRKACAHHYMDTGTYAREYATESAADDASHQLSRTQKQRGWNGPYLLKPLTEHTNPWRGNVLLHDELCPDGSPPGWDLNGDGKAELTSGAANVLLMTDVPEAAARALDGAIDKSDLAASVNWRTAGRVQWSESGHRMWILILCRT